MKTTPWQDIEHKSSAEERERGNLDALRVYDDFGKAQEESRAELALLLEVDRPELSQLEDKFDLLLCALAEHIRERGGELKFEAIFPQMSLDLMPLPPMDRTFKAALHLHPAARSGRNTEILATPE